MATTPESHDHQFDIREQVARIDKMLAVREQAQPEARLTPIVLAGLGSGAVFFAAGAIFAKLSLH